MQIFGAAPNTVYCTKKLRYLFSIGVCAQQVPRERLCSQGRITGHRTRAVLAANVSAAGSDVSGCVHRAALPGPGLKHHAFLHRGYSSAAAGSAVVFHLPGLRNLPKRSRNLQKMSLRDLFFFPPFSDASLCEGFPVIASSNACSASFCSLFRFVGT